MAWVGVVFVVPRAGLAQGLIEDFEDIGRIATTEGELTEIASGLGVTEGRRAAQLPPGASISFVIRGEDCEASDWLRVDVLTVGPKGSSLQLDIRGQTSFSAVGRPKTGRDTLALPLSVAALRFGGTWAKTVTLSLKNLADAPVVMDNLRLESADPAPKGCTLVDFGPARQVVWPGFEKASQISDLAIWSGDRSIGAVASRCPDPLTGDYVGPRPGARERDSLVLVSPSGGPAMAWLWVTHYAGGGTQPMEYAAQLPGQAAIRKRLTARQMLGPEGLMLGMGGAWTAEWFERVYVPGLVQTARVSLPSGQARVDMLNCQLAAMAIGPTSMRRELEACLKRVQGELSRYRRQFVVGARSDPTCEVVPLADEARVGMMVFEPPHDAAFSPTWSPANGDRVATVRAVVANGGLTVVPLAISPVGDTSYVSAGSIALQAGEGRGRCAATVQFAGTIPYVVDAEVRFVPWVLTDKHGPLVGKAIAHLAVVVEAPADAPSGVYRGTLRIAHSRGTVQLPVEVEVVHLGERLSSAPQLGVMRSVDVGRVYYALADAMSEGRLRAMNRQLAGYLFSNGLDAMTLQAVHPSRASGGTNDRYLLDELEGYPGSKAPGPTLLRMSPTLSTLRRMRVQRGSRKYRSAVENVVRRTGQLASKYGVRDRLFYLGRASSPTGLKDLLPAAAAVASAGAKSALMVPAGITETLSAEELAAGSRHLGAVIVEPDSSGAAEAAKAFRAARVAKVYARAIRPQRYGLGFYARAARLDGAYVPDVFGSAVPYGGFDFDATGLVVTQPDGSFAPTLALLWARQAKSDWQLLAQAERLLDRAGPAAIGADELARVILAIKERAAEGGAAFEWAFAGSDDVSPGQLEAWRVELIRSAQVLQKWLSRH